ncbi:MAG: hypothetical protein IJJ69_07810, partial [Oscillospiraceae bacterium]|nr:hypothetical protein [Oscillospiraceae bacterium]
LASGASRGNPVKVQVLLSALFIFKCTYNDIMNYVRKEYNIASYVGYANIDNYVPEFYKYTKYLYIETYQGDYYDYYQVLSSFNIYKKLKELDSYLT